MARVDTVRPSLVQYFGAYENHADQRKLKAKVVGVPAPNETVELWSSKLDFASQKSNVKSLLPVELLPPFQTSRSLPRQPIASKNPFSPWTPMFTASSATLPDVSDVPSLQFSYSDSSVDTEPLWIEYDSDATKVSGLFQDHDLNFSQYPDSHNGPTSRRHHFTGSRPESIPSFTVFDIANGRPLAKQVDPISKAPSISELTTTYPARKLMKPRGRKGPLKPSSRKATAEMRRLKACASCRTRKIRCDAGTPCQACINYHKCELKYNPCRGTQSSRTLPDSSPPKSSQYSVLFQSPSRDLYPSSIRIKSEDAGDTPRLPRSPLPSLLKDGGHPKEPFGFNKTHAANNNHLEPVDLHHTNQDFTALPKQLIEERETLADFHDISTLSPGLEWFPDASREKGSLVSTVLDELHNLKEIVKNPLKHTTINTSKNTAMRTLNEPPSFCMDGSKDNELSSVSPEMSPVNSLMTPPLQSECSFVSDYSDDDGVSEVTDYSEQTLIDSVEPQEEDASLQTFLRLFGLGVARSVLFEIRTFLEDNNNFRSHTADTGSSSSSHGATPKHTSTNSQSSNSTGKRSLTEHDPGSPDGGPGDDPGKRRRVSFLTPSPPLLWRKFACPFYKRNPERHTKWRSCAGPGWETIHRLKEHVYRRHALPIVCPRCGRQYETEDAMQKHSKEPVPCEVAEAEAADGYNKEQEKQLRGRKRPPDQTEADRWSEMYTILFPKDSKISVPSPYYESNQKQVHGQLVRFKEYLKEELPKKLWTDLQPDFQPLPASRQIELKKRIVGMVRNCTEDFFETCQSSFLSPPLTPRSSVEPRRPRSSSMRSDTISEGSRTASRMGPPDDLGTFSLPESYSTTASESNYNARPLNGYDWPSFETRLNSSPLSPETFTPYASNTSSFHGESIITSQSPAISTTLGSQSTEIQDKQFKFEWPSAIFNGRPRQCDAFKTAEDSNDFDYSAIMFSMGPINSSQWNSNGSGS